MKTYLLPIFALLIVGCGNRHSQQVATTQSIEAETTDSMVEHVTEEPDIEILPDSTSNVAGGESLNNIRFGNWTDKDWCDNDYFRALRKYIDACYEGEIQDEVLEPYKPALKGKFVIYGAQPHIGGGMFIVFNFLEAPNKLFKAWVYSCIDGNTKRVVDYQVRGGVEIFEKEIDWTKEMILSIIEEHPEHKLW